jgi:hypothetical protein
MLIISTGAIWQRNAAATAISVVDGSDDVSTLGE